MGKATHNQCPPPAAVTGAANLHQKAGESDPLPRLCTYAHAWSACTTTALPSRRPRHRDNQQHHANKLWAAMSNTVETIHTVALPWAAESLQATGQTHPKEHPSTLCSLGAREKIEHHVRHQGMHPIRALGMGKGTALT